jgi:glucose/arabinose dehydrogenase
MSRRGIAVASAVGAALVITACGGGSDIAGTNPPNDPTATFAAVPEPDGSSTASSTESGATEVAAGETSGPALPELAPTGDIDLPTGTPEELTTDPATTMATGPLPIPVVTLVDAGTFDTPVELFSRDGDPRHFVVEQNGRIIAADDLSAEVMLDITDLTAADGERGLLGAAFHPAQDLAYVHYTNANGTTVVDEYAIDPVTAIFDRPSRREVLTVEQPFGNHNGGELAFGPDGFLYLGLGDGGAANDPERNSLALASRLGKILRIDPRESSEEPFTIPADNPFIGVEGADPAIWALGLRNPWKFSFDGPTGDLWIADVGQGDLEEINYAPAINGEGAGRGLSFGWSAFEGTARFNDDQDPDGHTPPIVEYSHDAGDCSVSGGVVYRGEAIADLQGWFVYGDFCSGRIWGYDPTSQPGAPVIVELAQQPNLAAIAIGGEGELFAVSNVGTVSRFAAP